MIKKLFTRHKKQLRWVIRFSRIIYSDKMKWEMNKARKKQKEHWEREDFDRDFKRWEDSGFKSEFYTDEIKDRIH